MMRAKIVVSTAVKGIIWNYIGTFLSLEDQMINLLSGVKTREFISHFLIISVVFVACFLFGPTSLYADPPGPDARLVVTPSNHNVDAGSGGIFFSVSTNSTTDWNAQVISGGDWLTISKPDNNTINCRYKANSTNVVRMGTIRVTALAQGINILDSPQDVTVTQAAGQTSPVLSVSPGNREVDKDASGTTFDVANTGTGPMSWTATVVSGSWLSIAGGASGNNSGTITCSFAANPDTSPRTGTIRVTVPGASGSPKDVTVIQAGQPQPVPVLSIGLHLLQIFNSRKNG
jgi:hypothetical protein